MALDAQILQRLTQDSPKEAWRIITDRVLEIASKPLAESNAPSEVVKRDREIAELDLFLASSGWDLWRVFGQPEICGVERTSDRLARWWSEPGSGHSVARAVLILVFWHHWPDAKLHDYGAGQGLELLTRDAAQQLSSDDFWSFIERLATGRRLVITSDHGYAATGYFPDADGEVASHLKQTFSSGRSKAGNGDAGPFVPPVALQIDSPHGAHLLALGRRKWRSQGGYPTLTHGGLSLLEVLSPFVELSK